MGSFHFLLRVEQGGVLVGHIADPWIGGVDLQCGLRKGTEQVYGRTFHLAAVEPRVVILRTENGGHAVVDRAHRRTVASLFVTAPVPLLVLIMTD